MMGRCTMRTYFNTNKIVHITSWVRNTITRLWKQSPDAACSKINFPQSQSFKKKRRTCMFDRQNIDIRSNLLFLNLILSFKSNTGQRVKNANPKTNKKWWWSTCKNQFLREPRECSKSTIIHNKTRKLHHKNYILDLNTFLAQWHVYPLPRLCELLHETIWTRDLRCRRSHGMDA